MTIAMPKAFKQACLNLGQGTLELVSSPHEMVDFFFLGLSGNEKEDIRQFLRDIENSGMSDETLLKLWWASPADLVFYSGAEVRSFFALLLDSSDLRRGGGNRSGNE